MLALVLAAGVGWLSLEAGPAAQREVRAIFDEARKSADLALLEPVRAYKSRHASTLLIFEAIDKAIAAAQEPATAAAGA